MVGDENEKTITIDRRIMVRRVLDEQQGYALKMVPMHPPGSSRAGRLAAATGRRFWRVLICTSVLTSGWLWATVANAATSPAPVIIGNCEAAARVALPAAQVLSATRVDAGRFVAPASAGDLAGRIATMPGFCRIEVRATPTPQSDIRIEVWLPLNTWNGRFLGTGTGGAGGSIGYGMGMIEGLKRGFAVANSDLGTGPDVNALTGHPQRWADFGHRATHQMTLVAKTLIRNLYHVTSFRSYFEGCSTGGQQALVTAQRYPQDYDGILAGDPGHNRTHSTSYFIWNYQTMNASPASKLSPAQWSMVTRGVLSTCAGKDGGAPGDAFLTDPRLCRFDPATLPVCPPGGVSDACLSAPQMMALRRLYQGPVNPRTGERIYAGLTPGSEELPLGPIRMTDPGMAGALFVMRWGVGETFAPMGFDFDHDQDALDARLSSMLNANDSDLGDFRRQGGKLMIYTGLADPGVPYDDIVAYYDRVTTMNGGAQARDFARLFLIPGMGHCFGGPGVTDIGQPFVPDVPADPKGDALMALVAWTERNQAPEQLIAHGPSATGEAERERPVCAYPALPDYRSGDPARATSFACTPHRTGAGQVPALRYLN
jgi:feruloyl esterase